MKKFLLLVVIVVGVAAYNKLSHKPDDIDPSGPAFLRANVISHCQSATGQPTTCIVQIGVHNSSTRTFHWRASSEPPGAIFVPSSGSIVPGNGSGEIGVTTVACPVTFYFRDDAQNLQTSYTYDGPCSK